jgi:beta-lactamase regulating signal transducer with metallopeptidase domain
MMSALLDHLWQSTLVALVAGLLATAFHKARASVRFAIWFTASAKFLVPFALLGALGRLLAPAARPPVEVAPEAALIERAAQPFSQATAAAPAVHAAGPAAQAGQTAAGVDLALVLLGLWGLGTAALLVLWMMRWAKVREAMAGSARLALSAPMPVLASPWMREPGLVGLWRPVLLIPESLFDHLSRTEIEALVAHEACHLRRRDNLTAVVHMLVEALFWFHPLVWWIGARLIEAREQACDEAVVQSGHDRADYARSLVECCRLYLQSPLSCISGASGSNLERRVVAIMTGPVASRLTRSKKILLIAAGVCAIATPVTAGWLTSPTGREATAHVAAFAAKATAAALQATQVVRAVDRGPAKALAVADPEARPAPSQAAGLEPGAAIDAVSAEVSSVTLAPAPALQAPKASLAIIGDETPNQRLVVRHEELPLPETAAIIDPVWVRLPTLRQITDTSPNAADRAHIPGSASMQCRSDARGYLSRCVVLTESQAGLGFGKAALFLQTEFKLRTLDGGGTPVRGRLIDVTIEFTPKYWARIVDEGGGPQGAAPLVVRWVTDPLFVPYGTARYPWEALDHGVAAQVWLHCKVLPDGHLSDCTVARETPGGIGFGKMALLSKTSLLRVETKALDGSPMAGRTVEVRYIFNPPCEAMADSNQIPCMGAGGRRR